MPGRSCCRSRASFRAMGMLEDAALPQWRRARTNLSGGMSSFRAQLFQHETIGLMEHKEIHVLHAHLGLCQQIGDGLGNHLESEGQNFRPIHVQEIGIVRIRAGAGVAVSLPQAAAAEVEMFASPAVGAINYWPNPARTLGRALAGSLNQRGGGTIPNRE